MSKVCPTLATHWVQIKSPKKDSGFTWVQSHRSKPLCLPATITKWHQPVKAGMGTETWCQVGTSTDVYGTNGMCWFHIFLSKTLQPRTKVFLFLRHTDFFSVSVGEPASPWPWTRYEQHSKGNEERQQHFLKKGFFWHTEEQFCCKVVAFLNNNQFLPQIFLKNSH